MFGILFETSYLNLQNTYSFRKVNTVTHEVINGSPKYLFWNFPFPHRITIGEIMAENNLEKFSLKMY